MKTMEENTMIEVGMGQMEISVSPHKLITRGLGSCLGITFYDPHKKIGGMAHPMLPDINSARIRSNPHRFVNFVVGKMIEELEKRGCGRNTVTIKMFGGAHMFSFIDTDSFLNIGQKNIDVAHEVMKDLGLKAAVEEVGGTFGRTIELNLENGKVLVSTVSWGEKEV
jgi:chemotaxis protein CheD